MVWSRGVWFFAADSATAVRACGCAEILARGMSLRLQLHVRLTVRLPATKYTVYIRHGFMRHGMSMRTENAHMEHTIDGGDMGQAGQSKCETSVLWERQRAPWHSPSSGDEIQGNTLAVGAANEWSRPKVRTWVARTSDAPSNVRCGG